MALAFWERLGDLAFQAASKLLASIEFAGGGREIFEAAWKDFRKQLGLEVSLPLERAWVQHAAVCWLRLYTTELKYDAIVNEKGCALTMAQYNIGKGVSMRPPGASCRRWKRSPGSEN